MCFAVLGVLLIGIILALLLIRKRKDPNNDDDSFYSSPPAKAPLARVLSYNFENNEPVPAEMNTEEVLDVFGLHMPLSDDPNELTDFSFKDNHLVIQFIIIILDSTHHQISHLFETKFPFTGNSIII